MTDFTDIYDVFLSKITDDMYMEFTEDETKGMLQDLLLNAIPLFEFPRVNLLDYNIEDAAFNIDLSLDERNVLACYMIVEWLGQQLASVENTRLKYSGLI